MKKYFNLLKYELKTIYRDYFQLVMIIFPFVILLMAIYLFPLIIDSLAVSPEVIKYVIILLVIMLMSFGVFLIGAMGSFLLLEHKDEKTINTIAVTPLGVNGYLRFKIVYVYCFALISILIVLIGLKLFAKDYYMINGVSIFDNLSYVMIIAHSIVAALVAPALSLLQATFANNKIEGFAIMKFSSMIAMAPMIMVMDTFRGKLQYVLGVFPNFWAIKAIVNVIYPNNDPSNMSFYLYLLFGLILSFLVLTLCYRMFKKKVIY